MPDYSDEEALVFPSSDQENMATEPYEGSYDGQSEPADNEAQWQPEVVELFHQYDMNPSGFEQEEYMFSDDPYQEEAPVPHGPAAPVSETLKIWLLAAAARSNAVDVDRHVEKKWTYGTLDRDLTSDSDLDDERHSGRVKRAKNADGSVTVQPVTKAKSLSKKAAPTKPVSQAGSKAAVQVNKARKSKAVHKDEVSSIPPAKPQSKTLKWPRGRPPKAANVAQHQQIWKALVYVSVMVAPKYRAGKTSKGDKMIPQPSHVKGPFTMTRQTHWNTFLEEISGVTAVDKENLQVDAMTWGFQKQKDHLPLTSIEAFMGMWSVIKTQKDMSSLVVFVYYPIPRSSRRQQRAIDSDDEIQQRERVDDDTHYGRKLSLDQQLKPIIEGLQERYHVGSCPEHPTIRCSWNPGTEASWHIQLDDRRLNVWAHSILQKHVGYNLIPTGRAFFQPKDQLPPSGSEPTAQQQPAPKLVPTATSQTSPGGYFPGYPWSMPTTPQFYPFPTPPMPYNYGNGPLPAYNSPAGPGWAYHQQSQAPSTPRPAGLSQVQGEQVAPFGGFQPPPTPPVQITPPTPMAPQIVTTGGITRTTSSLDAWCKKHNLDSEVLNGLVKLGFRVGDKGLLAKLDDSIWEWAGLGPLHRMRVIAACDHDD